MAGTRRDIASLGAGWSPDLEWYAKAVAALQAKSLDDLVVHLQQPQGSQPIAVGRVSLYRQPVE